MIVCFPTNLFNNRILSELNRINWVCDAWAFDHYACTFDHIVLFCFDKSNIRKFKQKNIITKLHLVCGHTLHMCQSLFCVFYRKKQRLISPGKLLVHRALMRKLECLAWIMRGSGTQFLDRYITKSIVIVSEVIQKYFFGDCFRLRPELSVIFSCVIFMHLLFMKLHVYVDLKSPNELFSNLGTSWLGKIPWAW